MNLINQIDKASHRIYDLVIKTQLQRTNNLSNRLKNNIFLKREDQQPVFSFKIRGAYNRLLDIVNIENKKIYTCSAGNHAQGVALSFKFKN